MDQLTIENAVCILKNDEQIDAAISAGIITHAYVLSHCDDGHIVRNRSNLGINCQRTYVIPKNRIIILEESNSQKEAKQKMDNRTYYDECIESPFLKEKLDNINEIGLSLCKPLINGHPYVLDIDLDYFCTKKSVNPQDVLEFHKLIRGACAITIAREPKFVLLCRREAESIDSPYLEGIIKKHICNAQKTSA